MFVTPKGAEKTEVRRTGMFLQSRAKKIELLEYLIDIKNYREGMYIILVGKKKNKENLLKPK
jgi:hypothetical protein